MKNGGCELPRVVDRVVQAWTSGDSLNDLFFHLGDMETIHWAGAKESVEVQATSGTGEVEIKRAYSLSNDRISWDTPVVMSTDTGFVSALGYDYGTAETATPVTKRFIRFGFVTNQKSGAAIEQIRVRVMLDREPR